MTLARDCRNIRDLLTVLQCLQEDRDAAVSISF